MSVEEFREAIMQLKPGNFMALGGASAGIVGSSNGGSEAILQLQRSALEFTKVYKSASSTQALDVARRDVIAKIMVAHTVDAISEKRADELLEQLAQLMKERK